MIAFRKEGEERQGEVAVGHGSTVGRFPGSPLRVGMDPLDVTRHLREPVDPLLANGQPGAHMYLLPESGLQQPDQVIRVRHYRLLCGGCPPLPSLLRTHPPEVCYSAFIMLAGSTT